MPKLIYITLARFPTEKAHGLQIVQNCEAFAAAGDEVELWVSSRFTSHDLRQVRDYHAHYGVRPTFRIQRVAGIDLYPLTGSHPHLERIAFYVHTLSYLLFLCLRLLVTRADYYYSRDEYVLYVLRAWIARDQLAYEAHLFAQTGRGAHLQATVTQAVGSTIAITPRLRQDLIDQRGADAQRVLVAHDGVRAERFADLPPLAEARAEIGWEQTRFIVGFVGRLHMIKQDKGIGTLIDAIARCDGVTLALVGGPDAMAEQYRQQWLAQGLPASDFRYAGQVAPGRVPLYCRAFDVCAMPHPFTAQYAYYTSPLKLFEYMASARAIVASDLPAWADVVTHERDALLVPAGDVTALAETITRLQHDPDLRHRLGNAARERVLAQYTWQARARVIQAHLDQARASSRNTSTRA